LLNTVTITFQVDKLKTFRLKAILRSALIGIIFS
jgi:hypothetical protein